MIVLAHLATALVPLAQAGDKAGEEQPPLPADLVVPPAPVLSPEEELATFRVADGYRVELVAAEPLVVDPVVALFDDAGRLWVCEMRGYMPDVDGTGEDAPIGEIAVLTDEDGDGRMDARTTFLDGLVLPRAILPIRGGLLYVEPPNLIFARDVDGDGRAGGAADERVVLDTGIGGIDSPEHAANGLMLGVDGWIQLANHAYRYRWNRAGEWERQRVAKAGQWGIARDDVGRVYFNTNPDPLRGDPYSSHYAVRNRNLGRARGVNVGYAPDKRTWPGRITPGVNRGYQDGTLRDDFTLRVFTAACSPLIHRGTVEGLSGQAFVCEPAGNLVKRFALDAQENGALSARNVEEGREFWTSTDERFRPVHLFDGPDGALYCADLYRGIIQHRMFVTSFLRRQILERGLDQPVGLGRIWRVVRMSDRRAPVDVAGASWDELGALLGHGSGWVRDRAQNAFAVEGADDPDALAVLRDVAANGSALARMHAVWALSVAGRLDAGGILAALADRDSRVVHAGLRCAEPLLGTADPREPELVAAVERVGLAAGPDTPGGTWLVRQAILSLGEGRSPRCDAAMLRVLDPWSARPWSYWAELRDAALSGLGGRELDVVRLVATEWTEATPGRADLVEALARCIAREGRSEQIDLLLFLAPTRPPAQRWQAAAILRGVLAGRPKGPDGKPTYLQLADEPAGFARLTALASQIGDDVAPLARELCDALAWPGKEGVELPEVRALTDDERALFDRGHVLFTTACAQCHQTSGLGEEGKAPPLRYSPFVLGDAGRLARIVRHGLIGPIVIGVDGGIEWDGEMPAWPSTDEDLAAVLTYVRREWGHGAEPVTAADVARAIEAAGDRVQPYTAEELE